MTQLELTGTEKQVECATKIREVSISKFEAYANKRSEDVSVSKKDAVTEALVELLTYVANVQTEATWWIDNRAVGGTYGEKTYNMVPGSTFMDLSRNYQSEWVSILKKHKLA